MRKLGKIYNLNIGDEIEVGINEYGELSNSDDRTLTVKATVVGSSYGDPVIYLSDEDYKKHKKKIVNWDFISEPSTTNLAPQYETSLKVGEKRFCTIYSKYQYNKVGEPLLSEIEDKFGVKVGDKVKVFITKQNRLCTTTKSKTGKFAIGKVVGGYNSSLLIHFDKDNRSDEDVINWGVADDYEISSSIDDDQIKEDADKGEYAFHRVYNKKAIEKIETQQEEPEKLEEDKEGTKEDAMSENANVEFKLGDKILVERDSGGRLIDSDSYLADTTGKYPPVLCTVVGANTKQLFKYCVLIDDPTLTSIGGHASGYKQYIDAFYKEKIKDNQRTWNLHTYKPKALECFGVKVGDEIEVGATSNRLIDHNEDADRISKSVKGKVVGFEFKDGKPYAPLIYVDDASLKEKKINTRGSFDNGHKTDIFQRYLEDKSIDFENGCFWYLYGDKTFKKVSSEIERNKGKKMSNDTTRPEFWDMMKDNGKSALYRVAATQGTKGVKAAILKLMENQGSGSDRLKALEEVLDSQFGDALVSFIIGMSLTYAPKLNENEHVSVMARELRVNSMGTVGNVAADVVLQHFLPVITSALSSIPEEQQVRIGESKEEEQEEEKQEKKTATA